MKKPVVMRVGLAVALLATLAAAWFAPATSDDQVMVVERRPSAKAASSQVQSSSGSSAKPINANVEMLGVRDRSNAAADSSSLFEVPQWAVPKPPPPPPPPPVMAMPPPPPPPAPTAPPLPFRFMGRYVSNGQTTAFLEQGERSWAVKVGDSMDELYRVEGITENAVQLRYLPLNEVQLLEMGSAQ